MALVKNKIVEDGLSYQEVYQRMLKTFTANEIEIIEQGSDVTGNRYGRVVRVFIKDQDTATIRRLQDLDIIAQWSMDNFEDRRWILKEAGLIWHDLLKRGRELVRQKEREDERQQAITLAKINSQIEAETRKREQEARIREEKVALRMEQEELRLEQERNNRGHTTVRSLAGKSAKEKKRLLKQAGLTDYDIEAIRDASEVGLGIVALELRPCNYWPDSHTETIKRLIKEGLVCHDKTRALYVLTQPGRLLKANMNLPKVAKVPGSTTQESLDQETMDINWGRDGIVKSCGKLWDIWRNGEAMAERAQARQYLEFVAGHAEVEKSVQEIATSQQRVSARLVQEVPSKAPSYWSEDEQRAQNDQYWLTGGAAFWLNPNGPLAPALPAPDWWTPPESLESITARRLAALTDDTVARSLLPPPAKALDPNEGIGLPGEISEDSDLDEYDSEMYDYFESSYKVDYYKHAEPDDWYPLGFTSPVTEEQLKIARQYQYFGEVEQLERFGGNYIKGFVDQEELTHWSRQGQKLLNLVERGDHKYGDILRRYELQGVGGDIQDVLDHLLKTQGGRPAFTAWLQAEVTLEQAPKRPAESSKNNVKDLGNQYMNTLNHQIHKINEINKEMILIIDGVGKGATGVKGPRGENGGPQPDRPFK